MASRKKISRRKSKRIFTATAMRQRPINDRPLSRGGIRL